MIRHLTLCTICSTVLAIAKLAASDQQPKFVVVLYPEASDGSPGNALVDQGIRTALHKAFGGHVQIHNEYLEVSRFPDRNYQGDLAQFLRRKYAGRKIDLVMAGLGSGLDYALKYRSEIFPGVPIVFCAVDRKEIESKNLPVDVIGVPSHWDLAASLEVGLQCVPDVRHVFVVVGQAKFDKYWEGEARTRFQEFASRVKIVYLAGLPITEVQAKLATLPEHSLIYYLHVFEDGSGKVFMPAEALELISATANAPIFSHSDSYIGRGSVGGRVFSFESTARNAGELGVRILSGEKPEQIGIQVNAENAYVFDWQQLQRWQIPERNLPPGSDIRFKVPGLWEAYKWQIAVLVSLCVMQGLMIAGLTVQRSRRANDRRVAEKELHANQATLRELTGKLLVAEETERRRIARELHDDLGQSMALLAVELDLLQQKPPQDSSQFTARVAKLSARVKQLSSSIHELSHQLHPMKLEQLGLVAALSSFCKELRETHDLKIDFVHDEFSGSIPRDVSLCLYRIAQEALQNVMKHSGAQITTIKVHRSVDSIRLTVEDDGVGLAQQSHFRSSGLGLASMRERVRLINGTISFHGATPRGTRIEVLAPLSRTLSFELKSEV